MESFEKKALPDAEKLAQDAMWAKAEYSRYNPGELEGAELVGGAAQFFADQERLSRKEVPDQKERLKIYQGLTEFNFLWTHFVQTNKDKPKVLQDIWSRMEGMAKKSGSERAYMFSRSGVLTQVATMEIFAALGLNPNLSKPKDDAFSKIDMWVEEAPVQIKTNSQDNEVRIIETDTSAPLHVEVGSGDQTTHFSGAEVNEASAFRLKLDKYARESGKKSIKGFFLVLPKSRISRANGQPTPELIAQVREKMQALGYLPQDEERKAA